MDEDRINHGSQPGSEPNIINDIDLEEIDRLRREALAMESPRPRRTPLRML